MRAFRKSENVDVSLIMQAIVISITMVMGIIIVFAILGGVKVSTFDSQVGRNIGYYIKYPGGSNVSYNDTKYASNATKYIVSNVGTFFQIAPIMIVVIAAVGLLSYLFILRQRGQ